MIPKYFLYFLLDIFGQKLPSLTQEEYEQHTHYRDGKMKFYFSFQVASSGVISMIRSWLSEDQSSQERVINPAIASNWKVSKDENCYKNQ